jgi:hypothetical protein
MQGAGYPNPRAVLQDQCLEPATVRVVVGTLLVNYRAGAPLLYHRNVYPGSPSLHHHTHLSVPHGQTGQRHRLIKRYAPTTTSRAARTATIASQRNVITGEIVANSPAAACVSLHIVRSTGSQTGARSGRVPVYGAPYRAVTLFDV